MAERQRHQKNTYDCAKCGACCSVCPVYLVTGRESLTARGRLHLLGKLSRPLTSRAIDEIFSKCLLCGACAAICPRGIDITTITAQTRKSIHSPKGVSHLKKWLSRQIIAHPALLHLVGQTLEQIGKTAPALPKNSGLRLRLKSIPALETGQSYIANQPRLSAPPQAVYFTGCLANHLTPIIGRSSKRLVKQLCGEEIYAPPDQICCGLAAQSAGDIEQAVNLAQQNIRAFESEKWLDLPIFTSCASCFAQLKGYPSLFVDDKVWHERAMQFSQRVQEFSTYLLSGADNRPSFSENSPHQKIVYHDPCHLRFGIGHDYPANDISPARQLINKTAGLELCNLPHGSQCCGQGGAFRIGHPQLSQEIGNKLWYDFANSAGDVVTTTCTGCLLQWQEGLEVTKINGRVVHLAVLLAECLVEMHA